MAPLVTSLLHDSMTFTTTGTFTPTPSPSTDTGVGMLPLTFFLSTLLRQGAPGVILKHSFCSSGGTWPCSPFLSTTLPCPLCQVSITMGIKILLASAVQFKSLEHTHTHTHTNILSFLWIKLSPTSPIPQVCFFKAPDGHIFLFHYIKFSKLHPVCPGQLVRVSSCTPEHRGFNSRSGHMPRLQVQPLVAAHM